MWLCVCENIMKHFIACNIQFPECRRLTLCSCVMTILTSWKGLCGYDIDDMSCQDFCTVCLLRTFPSHFSICKQHVICDSCCPAPKCCIFLIYFLFEMISLIGNTVVRVLLYILWTTTLQFPLIAHYLYMSVVHLPKQYVFFFFKIVVYEFQVAGKHNFISLSYAPIFIFIDAEPGKPYRWRGAPVPCVCWYMYLQTSSQANIISRPYTLPMSVWYDFHWHHLLRNRCMKPSVVAMRKTVPLCCDL